MATQLADTLIDNQVAVVYGGGALGLMGCIANRYIERGGKIKGIIPEFMVNIEWAHPQVKDMHIVKDMHERKRMLMEDTDAIIALPGGTGTLEELMEVLALKRLGKYLKPIIILDIDGFYEPLLNMFANMVHENFLRPEHLDACKLVKHPNEVISSILSTPHWTEDVINIAPV
jgi:uncharacterized protein (TIGR00730 family)